MLLKLCDIQTRQQENVHVWYSDSLCKYWLHTGFIPVGYNEFYSHELCLFFFKRAMELKANENPHEFIYVDKAGLNLARSRQRGRNIIGKRPTVEMPGQKIASITMWHFKHWIGPSSWVPPYVSAWPLPTPGPRDRKGSDERNHEDLYDHLRQYFFSLLSSHHH